MLPLINSLQACFDETVKCPTRDTEGLLNMLWMAGSPGSHLLQLLQPQEEVNKTPAFVNLAQVMNVSFKFRRLVRKTSTFTQTQLIHLSGSGSGSGRKAQRVDSRGFQNQQVDTPSGRSTSQRLVNESFQINIAQTCSFTEGGKLNTSLHYGSVWSALHRANVFCCFLRDRERDTNEVWKCQATATELEIDMMKSNGLSPANPRRAQYEHKYREKLQQTKLIRVLLFGR